MVDNVNDVDTVETEGTDKKEPKFLTSEEVNRAISVREKAFEKRIAKIQEEHLKTLEKLVPSAKPEEKELSRTAELEKQVRELSKINSDNAAKDKAAIMRKSTEAALRDQGIAPDFMDHALAYLIDAKNSVRYDSDGSLTMTVAGTTYDLHDAIAAWVETGDAAIFKRASGAKGSGDRDKKNSNSKESTNALELKHREGWDKSDFTSGKNALTLTRDSKAALQRLVSKKLQQL